MSASLTFFALVFGDVACALEIVEREDVLQLCFVVDYRPGALVLALLQQVHQELLDVLRLLVAKHCCQVLFKDLNSALRKESKTISIAAILKFITSLRLIR